MDKNYDTIYEDYMQKFTHNSLGDEFRYDPDVVPTVIDLLKSLKNKLCQDDDNVKKEIDAQCKVIKGTKAIKNSSTCSTFDVMNESNLNTSATMQSIKDMPANIETLLDDLVKKIENENEIMEAYYTRSETAKNLEQYKKFLSEHTEEEFKNNGDEKGLADYLDKKQKVDDYYNLAGLTNLKNSKLVDKAINKKMAFSEAGQRKATGNSSSNITRATTYQTPTVSNGFSESNQKTASVQNVQTDNVKTNAASDTLKSSDQAKKETTKQTSSNMKTDMTKSPINSTTNNKKATTAQSNTKKSSFANGITTSIKNSISGKDIIDGAASTANKIMDDVESKAKEVSKEINNVKGTLSSSVKSFNNQKIKPLVKMTSSMVGTDGSKPNKFIPPIAGVTAAAVAGMGTKVYVDKETINKNKKNDQTKFFNTIDEKDEDDKEKEKQEEKNDSLSKEDLIRILENKN